MNIKAISAVAVLALAAALVVGPGLYHHDTHGGAEVVTFTNHASRDSKAYNNKRARRVQKTVAFAASGSDTIAVAGPCSEVVIGIRGTTDSHTLNAVGIGIERWASRIQITSSKRGRVGDADSMTLHAYSRATFGLPAATDTAAGAAGDGLEMIVPVGVDADELVTFSYTFGAFADMAGAVDPLASYTGTLRMTAVILPHNPETYWGYNVQPLGASGVIGVSTRFTQPTIPIIPGFALVGELSITVITSVATALTNALSEVVISQADDLLVDDTVLQLRALAAKRIYAAIPAGHVLTRHVPVANNEATQITHLNGTTATIAPSEILYLYQSGRFDEGGGAVPAPARPENLQQGEFTPPQPQRTLAPPAPEEATIGPGAFNLRRRGR